MVVVVALHTLIVGLHEAALQLGTMTSCLKSAMYHGGIKDTSCGAREAASRACVEPETAGTRITQVALGIHYMRNIDHNTTSIRHRFVTAANHKIKCVSSDRMVHAGGGQVIIESIVQLQPGPT